jgi:hypothetical protein
MIRMHDDGPPPIPGVVWLRLNCPSCDGDWWHGVDEESTSDAGPLLDPLAVTGLTPRGEDLVSTFAALLGVCADCREVGR